MNSNTRFSLLILSALLVFPFENAAHEIGKGAINRSRLSAHMVNGSSNSPSNKTPARVPVYGYEIVNTYKHDSRSFTQGLVFYNGVFFESAGQYGESTLRKIEIESGKILQKIELPDEVFAEGLTAFGNKLYQLTWQEQKAYVYDAKDIRLLREFRYQGNGWGLTNDGKELIMSDGTPVIRFIDPENFQTVRTISVFREDNQPLANINELEYVKGEIWATIWHSENSDILGKPSYIARIAPGDGKLLGWIDLDGISPDDVERESENVLNGIAYDAANDRIFVTGKNWKKLFEIKLKPKQSS